MGSNTTNYNLYKPDVGETGWGATVNTSTDVVDAQMKTNADAAAAGAAAIALNTTHRGSDGKDHSDVVTNNAKVSYTDAAAVGLNTTHRGSDGKDHSDVVTNNAKVSYTDAAAVGLNTTHRTSSGADHTYLDQSVVSGATPTFTGTNFTAIPYSGLANGTDGELITWNSSGVIDTVAVGTATHVLTSNGIGNAPTFQAAPGGIPTAITVADETTDTTCFPMFVTAATGDLGPKTAASLAFNSNTGMLTATGFTGPLTGQASTVATIAGLAPNTATTQAAQPNITSVGTLTSMTTSGTAQAADLSDGTTTLNVTELGTAAIEFVIDGGGSAITTGIKGDLEIPFACTIQRATLLLDQSATFTLDIWKDTYANFPPTVADTITAAAKPGTTATNKDQDATLTAWTTSVAAGDIIRFNVDANDSATRATISLKVIKV